MIYYFSKFLNGNVSFSLQDLCFHQILKYESHINYKTLNHTHTRTAAYTSHSPPVNIHSNGVPIVYFLMASLVVLYFLVVYLHPVKVKLICNIHYWHYRAIYYIYSKLFYVLWVLLQSARSKLTVYFSSWNWAPSNTIDKY